MEGTQFIVMCLLMLACEATEDLHPISQSLTPVETLKISYSKKEDTNPDVILKRIVRNHPTINRKHVQQNVKAPVDLLRKQLNSISKPVARIVTLTPLLSTATTSKHTNNGNDKINPSKNETLNHPETAKTIEKVENKPLPHVKTDNHDVFVNDDILEPEPNIQKSTKSDDDKLIQTDNIKKNVVKAKVSSNTDDAKPLIVENTKVFSRTDEIARSTSKPSLQERTKTNLNLPKSIETNESQPDENYKHNHAVSRTGEAPTKLENIKLFGVVFSEKLKEDDNGTRDIKHDRASHPETVEEKKHDPNNTIVISNKEIQEIQERFSGYQIDSNTEQSNNNNQFMIYNPYEQIYSPSNPYSCKADYNYYSPSQAMTSYSYPNNVANYQIMDVMPENRVCRTWKNTEIRINNNKYDDKPVKIDVQQNANKKLGANMQYFHRAQPLISVNGYYANQNTPLTYPSKYSRYQYA